MDPKATARTVYEDGVDESGNPTGEDNPKNSKYYREKIIHNDGSVTINVYERHTNRVVATKEATDPDQTKIWTDSQRTAQTQADQAERKVRRTSSGTDPSTGKPATVTEYESGDPRYDEIKPTTADRPQSVATNTTEPFLVTRQPDGSLTTDPNPNYQGPKPAAGSNTTVKGGDGKTYVVSIAADGTVTSRDSGIPADVKEPKEPTRLQDPETKEWLERQPDGTWAPIKVQGAQTGAAPDLGELKLQYGQIADGLQQRHRQYQEAVRAGTMTKAQADAAFKRDYELSEIKVSEINNVLSTQQSGFNQQVQQRGQTLDEVQSRRSLGENASARAISTVTDLGQYVRPGSISGEQGIAAMRALADMQMKYAGQAGGMREVPEIPVPTGMKQVLSLGVLEDGGILLRPQGAAGLGNLQQQFGGGAARPAGLMPPSGTPVSPPAAPGAPAGPPQPVMPLAPTTQVTPMSIAQSLLAEDDDPDWQYGVNKAMSLLL